MNPTFSSIALLARRAHAARGGYMWALTTITMAMAASSFGCSKTAKQRSRAPKQPIAHAGPVPHLVTLYKSAPSSDAFQFDAELQGTLLNIDGCIRIMNPQTKTVYTPVWSQSTQLSSDASSIVVMRFGKTLARLKLGSVIYGNGGELPRALANQRARVGKCPGPFWLMGYDLSQ